MQQSLNNAFLSGSNCGSGQTACYNSLSLDSIISVQTDIFNNAKSIVAAAAGGSPFRPMKDGSFITNGFSSASAFTQNKPVLLTNVNSEAASTIFSQNRDPLPEAVWPYAVSSNYDENRAGLIITSSNYAASSDSVDGGDEDARVQLQILGTDAIWRCPTWTFARNWVKGGGRAYVGMFQLGASYPGNSAVPQCTEPGVVCHQDDIEIVFGTVSGPTPAQAALVKEVQARYAAFLKGGAPNAAGYANWAAATSNDVHALNLGATGEAPVGACTVDYWGVAPQYDYQYYGL
jgi:carboxylesterase type B